MQAILIILPFLLLTQMQCYPPHCNACETSTSLRGVPAHSCVVLEGGHIRCWGNNEYGQLGYGHRNHIGDDERPASMGNVDVGGSVTQIATGYKHTCALLSDANVRCWGHNEYGQLGYGHRNHIGDDEKPASVGNVDVGGEVIQIAAGYEHTCALLSDANVRCWGHNYPGQLGYSHTNHIGDDERPASVGNVDVGGSVTQIAAGYKHTCALLSGGAVKCWGDNRVGQLGYEHTHNIGDDERPASVGNVDVGGEVIQIAAGAFYTCALLSDANVRCWGYNSSGQLGYGHRNHIGDDERPASVGNVDVGGKVIQIAARETHTCALLSNAKVRCWGNNEFGELGYGHTKPIGDNETPSSVGNVDVGGSVTQIAAGLYYTCALLSNAKVRCWGHNYPYGQLGYGHYIGIGDNEAPAAAGDVDIGGTVRQLW